MLQVPFSSRHATADHHDDDRVSSFRTAPPAISGGVPKSQVHSTKKVEVSFVVALVFLHETISLTFCSFFHVGVRGGGGRELEAE